MNNKFKRIWLFQHIFEIWEYFPHNPSVVISYMLFETTALPDTIWHAFIALLVWYQSLYLRAVDLKRLEIVFTQQHHVCTVWLMNPNKVQGVVNAVNLLEFCMWGIVFEFSFRKSMQSRIPPSGFFPHTDHRTRIVLEINFFRHSNHGQITFFTLMITGRRLFWGCVNHGALSFFYLKKWRGAEFFCLRKSRGVDLFKKSRGGYFLWWL